MILEKDIPVLTVGDYYEKAEIILFRDELFDKYLESLDQVILWEVEGKSMVVSHHHKADHQKIVIDLLYKNIRSISEQLIHFDELITKARPVHNNEHTILEIN